MLNITWVGRLKYFNDWQEIEPEQDDLATLINCLGAKAHIFIDDGDWVLEVTQDGVRRRCNFWFPEAVDCLVRLHLREKTGEC